MAKGYWLARLTVTDASAYGEYRRHNEAIYAKFGARFIVRGGKAEAAIGPGRQHNVVIEFGSYDEAVACFHSPDYQAAAQLLETACEIDIVICEGYEGAQPA
jgi:uncharacterized protein (DUF1330 family)